MKKILITASLVSLGIGFWGGWNELSGVLIIGFLSFGFLLFISHLDQISEFKASSTGIEAKTREVITKAENAIIELQSLARIFAETTLSSVKRAGRIGGYSDDDEKRIKDEVLNVLSEIGVQESEYDSVLSDWHKFTKFDYSMYILGHSTIPQGFDDNAIQKEWKALRDFNNISSPEVIKEFLEKWGLLDKEKEEQLADYEYYIKRGEHRRPDVWADRKNWGNLKCPNKKNAADA